MAPRRAAGQGFLMGKRGGAPRALVAAALCASAAVLLLLPTAFCSPSWTAQETVSDTSSSNEAPMMALDSQGNPHVTWGGWDGSEYRVFYSKRTGSGWSEPVNVSETSTDNHEPRIALDPAGRPHVAWTGHDGSQYRVYYSADTGAGWSAPLNLSSTSNVNGRPRIAVDLDGNPHVTWRGSDGGIRRIYYSKYAGGGWSAPQSISAGYSENYDPQIALDPDGNPHITWYALDHVSWRIYYSANTGGGWSAQQSISPDSGENDNPRIALDSGGNPHVTWRGWDGAAKQVYYSRNTGGGWTPAESISSGSTENSKPQIAVDAAGNSRVTWYGYDGSTERVYYSSDTIRTITASASPAAGGTITGAGAYNYGDPVNLHASANTGYHFLNWTEGEVVVHNSADYSFTATTNRTLTANFVLMSYNVNASVEPDARGNVSPLSQIVKHGSKATIKLMPDPGCRVTSIRDNGAARPIPSDTESASYYVIDKVKENHNVVVDFAPVPKPTWYLAEGTTAWGFSTYISIQNPNPSAVTARVTLMPRGGTNANETMTLAPNSQTTLSNDYLASKLAGEKDFSTRVEAGDKTKSIAVDRTMTWTGPGASSPEAHSSIGVTSPARTWYLPEGSTDWGFETWLLIQNPSDKEASCEVTYMIEGKGPQTITHKVPARSRESFSMKDDIGTADASIKVESKVPVIPERAMYRYDRREGHDSIGTTTPARDYFLAEGAVGYPSDYTTWVLVQNPQGTTNNVTVTYLTGEGEVKGPSFTMKPNTRATVRANDTLPPGTDVSTRVSGSAPLIAERAMYWSSPAGEACHDSIGTSTPARVSYLPDGQTSGGRETWTLVQNPHDIPVEIMVSYLPEGGGTPVSFTSIILPNSRKTFNMAEKLPGKRASIVVESIMGGPVICERAMYWSDRAAGTDTIGGFSN